MAHVLPGGGGKALMDIDDTALLLLDHQWGLFQTVKDISIVTSATASMRRCASALRASGRS